MTLAMNTLRRNLPHLVASVVFCSVVALAAYGFELAAYKPIDVFVCGICAGIVIARIQEAMWS